MQAYDVETYEELDLLREKLYNALNVCGGIWQPFGGKNFNFLLAMSRNCTSNIFTDDSSRLRGLEKVARTDIPKLQLIKCPISQRAKKGELFDENMNIIIDCIRELKRIIEENKSD